MDLSYRSRRIGIAAALGVVAALSLGCPQPPDQPEGLVVDIKSDSSGPLVLVDNKVVYPSQRDSVLRSLQGVTLDSLQVLAGGTDATFARFGSRGASGVVLVYTRPR